jgi:hypothetical protein
VVGEDLRVVTTPIIPGTHTITFTAEGAKKGDWENCAEMTSDAFSGTALACSEGEVRAHRHDDDGKKWWWKKWDRGIDHDDDDD